MMPPTEKQRLLDKLAKKINTCSRCTELYENRENAVPGEGNPDADIMLVGEAPGRHEDEKGIPFVGRSGNHMDKHGFNESSLNREDVFITNVVKCHPPGNRNPTSEECEACSNFFEFQLRIIQPVVIVTIGKISSQIILERDVPITKENGSIHKKKIPFGKKGQTRFIVPCLHPAYFLQGHQGESHKLTEAFDVANKIVKKLTYKQLQKQAQEVF